MNDQEQSPDTQSNEESSKEEVVNHYITCHLKNGRHVMVRKRDVDAKEVVEKDWGASWEIIFVRPFTGLEERIGYDDYKTTGTSSSFVREFDGVMSVYTKICLSAEAVEAMYFLIDQYDSKESQDILLGMESKAVEKTDEKPYNR